MHMGSMVAGVAVVALASAATVTAQADLDKIAKLRNPAGLTAKAPDEYKVEPRHERRRNRDSGAPRLGADRRRSFL